MNSSLGTVQSVHMFNFAFYIVLHFPNLHCQLPHFLTGCCLSICMLLQWSCIWRWFQNWISWQWVTVICIWDCH